MPPKVSDYPDGRHNRNSNVTFGWHLRALTEQTIEEGDDWALATLPYQDEPCRMTGESLSDSYDMEHLRGLFLLALAAEETNGQRWPWPNDRLNERSPMPYDILTGIYFT